MTKISRAIIDDMLERPWWWIDQDGLDEAEEETPGLLTEWAARINRKFPVAAEHLRSVRDDMERIRKEDEVWP